MSLTWYTILMEETAQEEAKQRGKIHQFLKQAGHEVETVEPTTADSPLPTRADLENNVGDIVEDVLTGGAKSRGTQSKNFLQKQLEKLRRQKNQDEEILEKAA